MKKMNYNERVKNKYSIVVEFELNNTEFYS